MHHYLLPFALYLIPFWIGTDRTQEEGHRFQFDTHTEVHVFFDSLPSSHPKIRLNYSMFRPCLDIYLDSLGLNGDGHYHYKAVVSAHRIEPAAILFGSYYTPEKRLSFALIPQDTVRIHVALDANRKVKDYRFEGKSSQLSEYYQKKAIHLGYALPQFLKVNCEGCDWDSIVSREQTFIRENAPQYQLSEALIAQELAHAKMDYTLGIVPIEDYAAMRLNDHFLRIKLKKIRAEILGKAPTGACLMPGQWQLKDRLDDVEMILQKASSTVGCRDELVLRLLYYELFPKLKSSDDFAIFRQLTNRYLIYQPYRDFLERKLVARQNNRQPSLVQAMRKQGLIKEGESFFVYLKSDKDDYIHWRSRKYFKQLSPEVKFFIMDLSADHISGPQAFQYAPSTHERVKFCCLPFVIAYNARRQRALSEPSIKLLDALELMADGY